MLQNVNEQVASNNKFSTEDTKVKHTNISTIYTEY